MSDNKTNFDIDNFVAKLEYTSFDSRIRRTNQVADYQIKCETHKTRMWLLCYVGCITLLWLVFTAIIVLMVGFRFKEFTLSDTVMVAFLTTSLATVLGLLGIGLNFYFSQQSNSIRESP
ncbi:MAG: hypothetical protein LBI05_05195 [Planctomycetaceae bacterium]|jgi:hypothetical protein|nr:hypothetical protein [Planctomycetaceae bacterium]